jgi:putative tricarboxylic transport membrane protein
MRERACALGILVLSGAYLVGSLGFPAGTFARPGPGFFPVAVGVFLCGAAAVLTVTLGRGLRSASVVADAPAEARARVAATVVALVGFCLLLPWGGYPICAFVFVALLLRRLGDTGWVGALVTAGLAAVVTFYVFGVLLGVPLPRGPF